MSYTITHVHPTTRPYKTQYGDNIEYTVKFQEMQMPVHIGRKVTSKPPVIGEILEGTVDMSGQYGPKFKQTYDQNAPRPAGSGGYSGGGSAKKFDGDNYTMYLSYAKDIAIACVGIGSLDTFEKLIEAADKGAKVLYAGRPGAAPETPSDSAPDQLSMDNLHEIFPEQNGPETVVPTEDDPWKGIVQTPNS